MLSLVGSGSRNHAEKYNCRFSRGSFQRKARTPDVSFGIVLGVQIVAARLWVPRPSMIEAKYEYLPDGKMPPPLSPIPDVSGKYQSASDPSSISAIQREFVCATADGPCTQNTQRMEPIATTKNARMNQNPIRTMNTSIHIFIPHFELYIAFFETSR